MRRHGRTAFTWCATGAATLAFGVLDASCRDPTEVTLRVTTSEPCGNFQGVAITVGPDVATTQANFAQHFVNATSTSCDVATGLVGTLVLTPGNTTGSVLIAGGVRKPDGTLQDPSQCGGGTEVSGVNGTLTDPSIQYCIIARRTFAFVEHTSLTLPINLDKECIGRDCYSGSTCYQGGCVTDNVVCSGADCGLPEQNPGQNPDEIDASGSGDANVVSSSDGSYDAADSTIDSSSFDSGNVIDSGAATDSGYGLPACLATTQSGGNFVGTCNENGNGTGVATCSGTPDATNCCGCACVSVGIFEGYASCTGANCESTCTSTKP